MDTSMLGQAQSETCSRAGSRTSEDTQRKRSRAAGSEAVMLTSSLAERPLVDTRDALVDTLMIRCGLNEECLLADSVRYVLGAYACVVLNVVAPRNCPCAAVVCA
jgi:hypothetical protein